MTQQLLDLAGRYPEPNPEKLNEHLGRLQRMCAFYDSKIPDAPVPQDDLFRSFVNTLNYTIATLKIYRKITTTLSALAKETRNAEPTDAAK